MLVHHRRSVSGVVREHDTGRRNVLRPGGTCTRSPHRSLTIIPCRSSWSAVILDRCLIAAARVRAADGVLMRQQQIAIPRRVVVVRVLLLVLVGVRVMTIRVCVAGRALVAQMGRVRT